MENQQNVSIGEDRGNVRTEDPVADVNPSRTMWNQVSQHEFKDQAIHIQCLQEMVQQLMQQTDMLRGINAKLTGLLEQGRAHIGGDVGDPMASEVPNMGSDGLGLEFSYISPKETRVEPDSKE